jgi:hypothetical protein
MSLVDILPLIKDILGDSIDDKIVLKRQEK